MISISSQRALAAAASANPSMEARQINVGEDDPYIRAGLQDQQRIVGSFCFEGLETCVLDNFHRRHPNQRLVLDDQDHNRIGGGGLDIAPPKRPASGASIGCRAPDITQTLHNENGASPVTVGFPTDSDCRFNVRGRLKSLRRRSRYDFRMALIDRH